MTFAAAGAGLRDTSRMPRFDRRTAPALTAAYRHTDDRRLAGGKRVVRHD
jgi:hypothetical protein